MASSRAVELQGGERAQQPHDGDALRHVTPPHPLETLQSQIGNAGLVTMLQGAQAKLAVGHASDPAELEADAIAGQVVSSLGVQRGGGGGHQCAPTCSHSGGVVNRSPVGMAGGDLDASVEQRVQSSMNGGSPLPDSTRQQMEGAFGADFSGVRVHADETSSELARSMSAKAFTLGGHIFLGGGHSTSDHQLMAHELTHTIQQGAATQQSEG